MTTTRQAVEPSQASTQVAAWDTVLDAYEARLQMILDATAAGDPGAVPLFLPPTDLGPMPEVVVPRARALLVRSRELEQTITQARDAVRAKMQARPAAPAATRSRLDLSL